MIKFLIVRHGHSIANEKSTFAGITDIPLSETGKKQAKAVSEYILQNYKIDAIYSSELTRAKDTVKLVSETLNIPIITNSSFNEIYGGKWEGLTFERIYQLYPNDLTCWLTDILNSRCTEGESFSELSARTVKGLKNLTVDNEGKTVLIATHAGALRSLLSGILNLSASECANLGWVSNASLTTIIYDNGNFSITQKGYDEYLNSLKTALPKNI